MMNLPRKDTNAYRILRILYKNGALGANDLLRELSFVSMCRRSWVMESINSLLKKNLVRFRNDKYYLHDETIAMLEGALEIEQDFRQKNIVSSPYHNIFTPELKNYNLFLNKRGY